MKRTLITLSAVFAVTLGSLQARTWTSKDGSKSFEGDYRSFDSSSGVVSVIINGRLQKFHQDLLSDEDRAFLAEMASKPAGGTDPKDLTEELEKTKMGTVFAKAKLHRLDGKRFRRTEMTKVPEYYILYYSASW